MKNVTSTKMSKIQSGARVAHFYKQKSRVFTRDTQLPALPGPITSRI
ncbi:hypothetical protein GJR95_02530 [Spirosoma endbachense]|uniref:Uncharacterized protein n=1 Tax=Spirosoma endbachense TaxID=2666025 RepID=A0A6P1VNG5_9BACT|nr:hypothetical protein GJR95_02530 [Spirosoma endbachense]